MKVNSGYIKRYVYSAACTGMLLFGIVMISLGSILPDIKEKFQLNETEIGYLATLLPLGVLVGSLLFGPLLDALSYKKILIAGAAFTGLGLLGIAVADRFILLNATVFCIGLGGGMLNGVTNALVSDISEGNPGADLSLLGVFFGVGALGTPTILGVFKGVYTFEEILLSLMALTLLILVFFLMISFPSSKVSKGISLAEALKMLRDPLLLLLGAILFFQAGLEGLTNNWTTSYLEKVKNLDASKALFALSAIVAALTFARLVLGKLLRIFRPLNVMVASYILAFAGGIFLYWGDNYQSIILALIVVGFGLAATFPVILGYVGQIYTRHSGTAFSIVITIALIGNVIANHSMGQLAEKSSLTIFPYFLISGVLVLFILLFVLNRQYKNA